MRIDMQQEEILYCVRALEELRTHIQNEYSNPDEKHFRIIKKIILKLEAFLPESEQINTKYWRKMENGISRISENM